MTPGWVPETQELNDRIAEASLRAEQARIARRQQLRAWMPTLAEPFTPEVPIPFTSQQTRREIPVESPDMGWGIPDSSSGRTKDFESFNLGSTPKSGTNIEDTWQPPVVRQQTRPQAVVSERTPSELATGTTQGKEYAGWEKPAEWAEAGQKLMAQGLSNVPLLPQGLAAIAPAFEWVHENIEKPLASVLTTPFRGGKSYEEWDAPTYVKGLAEMPLWWLPWVGWAGAGVKALGVSAKVGKVAAQAVKATGKFGTEVILPSEKFLETAFKADPMRLMAKSVENVPVLKNIVKAVSGPLAFAISPGEYAWGRIKVLKENRLNRANMSIGTNLALLERWENGAKPLAMANVLKHGDTTRINKVLDMKGGGIVGAAKPNSPQFLNDIDEVIRSPSSYTFATLEAKNIVQTAHETLYGAFESALKEGAVTKFRIGRTSTGKVLSDEAIENMARAKGVSVGEIKADLADNLVEESLTGSRHYLAQHHTSMAEGRKAGVQYSDNFMDYVDSNFSYYGRRIAGERLNRNLKALDRQNITPDELWADIESVKSVQLNQLIDKSNAIKYARVAVNSLAVGKGTSVAGAVMGKVRITAPDIARRIESALVLKKDAIRLIPQALGKLTGLSPADVTKNVSIINEVNKAFIPFGAKKSITLAEITDALKPLNLERQTEATLIKEAYRQAFKRSGTELKTIREELDTTLSTMKSQVSPLKKERSRFLQRFAEDTQALGENRSIIRDIPAFRGRIFDTDIAQQLEKFYGPQGKSWVSGLAQASAVGRAAIANLDLSMPFIQGLYVLSRSPRTWGKLVGKQLDFLVHPQNTAKYLISNENITREMALYGSSFSTFEYAQAAGALGKFAQKLGPPGKVYAGALKRTEAAFTGGGNVARVEMWKALRREGMSPDELRELSRTLDRMTGVMSMRELGISKRQQDYENAWVFFAPRYTRAGLSYVNDAFTKGGITGTEARMAIASLAAGGTAFYIGAAKAAGQQPNLDPTSGKFMTLKVGDAHVGIGGVLYSLTRLQSNVLAQTPIPEMMQGKEGEWKLKNLLMPVVEGKANRENPFVRFLLGKSSVLTGTLSEVIEQKDFIGRPFEDPADWARFVAEKALPISVSQAMEPGMSPLAAAGGVIGLRSFPKSAWELRNEARDKIAQEQFGRPYADLNELQQMRLNKDPQLKALQAEADKQTEMRGGESADSLKWRVERGQARGIFVDTMNRAQAKYDAGLMTGLEFKELLQKGSYAVAQSYKQIDQDPAYQKTLERMSQGKAKIGEVGEVAYNTLAEASWSGKFDDEFGMFDYNAYQTFRETLRSQAGPAAWDYVLDKEAEHKKDLPPLAQEYYTARETLRPYWMIQAQVEKLFGKRFAESNQGQALINRQKKAMRLGNAQVAKYIQLFYRD